MNEYLRLNNGAILQDSKAYNDGIGLELIIGDDADDIREVRKLLSVKEITEKIVYHYYGVDISFEGFTKLASVKMDGKKISARLEKEVKADESRDMADN